jgi:hypothetical protein
VCKGLGCGSKNKFTRQDKGDLQAREDFVQYFYNREKEIANSEQKIANTVFYSGSKCWE